MAKRNSPVPGWQLNKRSAIMRKFWLITLILVGILALTGITAAKYIPYVEPLDGDWGDVAQPWHAPGGFSTVLYGRVESDEDVDAIAYEFIEPTSNWLVELAVPVCGEHFAPFIPSIAVLGDDLPTVEADRLPFELPQGMGALVLTGGGLIEMARSENYLFSGETQRFVRYDSDILLNRGEYLLVVWEPDGHTGAYALSIMGVHPDYVDAMEANRIDEAFDLVNSGSWMGQDCDAAAVSSPVADMPMLLVK
jgi:hypothetical protein